MKKKGGRHFQQILLTILGLCIVAYFIYHTIEGDRGWFALVRMKHEVAEAKLTLEKLKTEREDLQHSTQLLQSKGMDPDLLDEKSRELLNYSKPNDIVILVPKEGGKEPSPQK